MVASKLKLRPDKTEQQELKYWGVNPSWNLPEEAGLSLGDTDGFWPLQHIVPFIGWDWYLSLAVPQKVWSGQSGYADCIKFIHRTVFEHGLETRFSNTQQLDYFQGMEYRDRVTAVLKDLQWLCSPFWAQFRALVLTFNVLSGLEPECLKDQFLPYCSACKLRSTLQALCSMTPPP